MLAINQLIKIIIGVVVIAVVVAGFYFFGDYITDFFKNISGGEGDKEPSSIYVLPSEESTDSQPNGDDSKKGGDG